jgi:multiple sugar transport system permease protein
VKVLARRLAFGAGVALLLAFSLVPFYWMLMASLKDGDEQLIFGNPWWVRTPDWSNYGDLIHSSTFGRWMLTTALVIGATLLISVTASLLAAYALARLRVPFSRSLVLALFATYLVPQSVFFLPLVKMLSRLHLTNSPLALILTYPSLVIPFGTWVLWAAFRVSPLREWIDQAETEGAGLGQMLIRVVVPLAAPALAAVSLFAVAIILNDYLYAFAFIQQPQSSTLMGAVATLNVDIDDAGFLFAAVLLGTLPLALGCAFFADTYARGLGTGLTETVS